MSYDLQVLADNRDALLLAEVAAWLHNLGKLDPNFIGGVTQDEHRIDGYRFQRFVAPDLNSLMDSDCRAILLQNEAPEDQIDLWVDAHNLPDQLKSAITTLSIFVRRQGPLYIPYIPCRRWNRQARKSIDAYVEAKIEEEKEEWKKKYPSGWEQLAERKKDEYQEQRREELRQEWEQVLALERKRAEKREEEWYTLALQIVGVRNTWSLGNLLTLFWDDFFDKPGSRNGNLNYQPGSDNDPDYHRKYLLTCIFPNLDEQLPALLILAHGEVSGQEKAGLTETGIYRLRDEGRGTEEDNQHRLEHPENFQEYSLADLRLSTAFGYETSSRLNWETWIAKRLALIKVIPRIWGSPSSSQALFQKHIAMLRHGISDARLPFNEISLFDYSASIAALFKTAVAQYYMINQMPTPATMRWRLASIRLDAFDFLFQANQVADLIARKQLLTDVYQLIAHLLEVEVPVASRVYSDEHGLVMVLPELPGLTEKQLEDELSTRVLEVLENPGRLTTLSSPPVLHGAADVRPTVTVGPAQRGKKLNLQTILSNPLATSIPSAEQITSWWSKGSNDRCTVCGVRPIGYMEPGLPDFVNQEKAKERQVCGICLARRGRRAEGWAKSWQHAQVSETIWIDEVADINGRFALIVGHFDLNHWLNGTLVRSLAIGTDEGGQWLSKPPTFARISRIWRTTKKFWEDVQQKALSSLQDDRRRLVLHIDKRPNLGQYHVYDLDLGPTSLSVAWIPPQDGQSGYLVSTDNLQYTARQLGAETETSADPALSAIFVEDFIRKEWVVGKREPKLRSPEGAVVERQSNLLRWFRLTSTGHQNTAYAPVIPILAEPRTFMALVPANKALDVVQAIKAKYEREMGKVRNRLPLHLGVVYAGRRIPLRAVLDAGRRMLKQKALGAVDGWKVVEDVVKQTGPLPAQAKDLADGTLQFTEWYAVTLQHSTSNRTLTWYVPAVMGDGRQTADHWYPYVFLNTGSEPTDRRRSFQAPNPFNPGPDGEPQLDWLVHAGELKKGDVIYFTPSTFDFEYLDTSARRFEVAYEGDGRRRGLDKKQRPYLLEEVEDLEDAWEKISSLATSQIKALEALIEGKRQAWKEPTGSPAGVSDTFRQFVSDTLHQAGVHTPVLENAVLSGLLTDAIELHMQIMK